MSYFKQEPVTSQAVVLVVHTCDCSTEKAKGRGSPLVLGLLGLRTERRSLNKEPDYSFVLLEVFIIPNRIQTSCFD
jgi:hypothetical protein